MTTTTTKRSTKRTMNTLADVFASLVAGNVTAADAIATADSMLAASTRKTVADTAVATLVRGEAAERQYVADNGLPADGGQAPSVKSVAEHMVETMASEYNVTTLRNSVKFRRDLLTLNVTTVAGMLDLFDRFATYVNDAGSDAHKSAPDMYRMHAVQFQTFISRLAAGRIDADGIVVNTEGVTIADAAKQQRDRDKQQQRKLLAALRKDGAKVGSIKVTTIVAMSKDDRDMLRFILDHYDALTS